MPQTQLITQLNSKQQQQQQSGSTTSTPSQDTLQTSSCSSRSLPSLWRLSLLCPPSLLLRRSRLLLGLPLVRITITMLLVYEPTTSSEC
jgi:hypothetical protein